MASAEDQAVLADMTSYPQFQDGCVLILAGHSVGSDSPLQPKPEQHIGRCQKRTKPLVFSVTHENRKNSHVGSRNYDPGVTTYMSDFSFADLGRWIDLKLQDTSSGSEVALSLDTVNYSGMDAVTGWPLRYGHLFVGLNDPTVNGRLDERIVVEFDLYVSAADVEAHLYQGYSGDRVLLGALTQWDETAPRKNRSHFLEINFLQSSGYSDSYNEMVRPKCQDRSYDRCFYDPEGHYAEGREIRYPTPIEERRWLHLSIPISDLIHALPWVSPPSHWEEARLVGIYFGMESEGASRTSIRIKNYHVYQRKS